MAANTSSESATTWVGAIHESPVLGSVLGPVVAGAIWDRWQTYEPLLWGLVVMFFLLGVFYSLLEKPWVGPTLT